MNYSELVVVDGYIRKYNSTKYIALFHSGENYQRIFDTTRYLIMLRNRMSNMFSMSSFS